MTHVLMESKKFHALLVATFEAWNANISEFITFSIPPHIFGTACLLSIRNIGAVIYFTIENVQVI